VKLLKGTSKLSNDDVKTLNIDRDVYNYFVANEHQKRDIITNN